MSITTPSYLAPTTEEVIPQNVLAGLHGRVKRAMDVLFATIGLVFLLPLFVAIALVIKVQDGGPVLFCHRRRGYRGRHFMVFKFRTMRPNASEELERLLAQNSQARADWHQYRKLRRDPRMTPFGYFLRRSSLDELPQLVNVLLGTMSLVGPRPIMDEEHARFGAMGVIYDAAKPGITGLWQVSGRNDTDFPTRIRLDTEYIRQWSLRQDLLILCRTLPVVLLAKGAY